MAAAATRLRGCGLPPPSPSPSATAAAVAPAAAVASPAAAAAAGLLIRTRPWRLHTRRQSDTDAASSRWGASSACSICNIATRNFVPHTLSLAASLPGFGTLRFPGLRQFRPAAALPPVRETLARAIVTFRLLKEKILKRKQRERRRKREKERWNNGKKIRDGGTLF
ncbi:uncharacterized protein LOC119574164 [Penaeus monodon]|uniref:uncharacterized protein LOC119574164 n=1 Tax=Penaeus monodon TaxID=6687 RepID=UPI0018A71195|nr:uncharacterized protein LOC119574164 [Penaeus monodon]XP_037777184.1 uncharacterized protein LOC119574164 [Penaeus monodon]